MADKNLEVVNLPPPVEPADNISPVLVGLGGLLRIGISFRPVLFLQYVTTSFEWQSTADLPGIDDEPFH